jgi:deoxycytidylate deaminase
MALAQAFRKRADLKGARFYVTLEPCAICAGLLIECGIRTVIVPHSARSLCTRLKAKWKKSIAIGRIKLAEAGVKVVVE